MNLIIELTQMDDAITLGDYSHVLFIFENAEKIINNGGKIIIQRAYLDSAPRTIIEYSNIEELHDWKSRLSDWLSGKISLT